jgi:hypothetical protein
VKRIRTHLRAVMLVAAVVLIGSAGAQGRNGMHAVSLRVDRTSISTKLGRTFFFTSTITNDADTTASGLIAHLNLLSLRDGVYVDPEDWSSNRTRYLAPIPAGGSTTITWKMAAVNAGSVGVYVAVLPRSGLPRPPTVGPTIRVAVAERRTLNSAGILPLALGIPGALGVLALGVRLRRRRAQLLGAAPSRPRY